jgi:hypothetical protein
LSSYLSFQDGLGFIRDNLNKIDYIILDIDLPAYSTGDEVNESVLELLKTFEGYEKLDDETEDEELLGKKCNELKGMAGFYLYTELVVELGFPKQHILFCSNHGENTKSIQEAFKTAKIALPRIYEKANPEVQKWVKECHENPYSRLRRGIIEGCNHLKGLDESQIQFNLFVQETEKQSSLEDIHNYLDVLANFLPLREPDNKTTLYKLFIRTLSHEWEAAVKPSEGKNISCNKEIYAFYRIMKTTRNWVAHNANGIFDKLTEQDLAYLFLCNMRAMFRLNDSCVLNYEEKLLSLFEENSKPKMKEIIGSSAENRQLKLANSFTEFFKHAEIERSNFFDALNVLQEKPAEVNNQGAEFFISGLYLGFWFLTSDGYFPKPIKDRKNSSDEMFLYRFNYFDYSKQRFLFELSRHIYIRSFQK